MAENNVIASEGGNITKFRPDRRGAACGLLKSIALLGLLCSMIYCVWNYHEQLTLSSLRKLAATVSAAQNGQNAEFAGYSFEAGTDSVYDDFGSGLAVLSSDTLSFINGAGREELSVQLKYANPALSVASDNMLAYDRGGKKLCFTNRYTSLWETSLSSDIISANVNTAGAFCVVTDEQGYRAAVTLYDMHQKRRFKWKTSEYYIMQAAAAPDLKQMAVLCMSQKDGSRVSAIRVFDTSKEDPKADIPLGSLTVYSMEYYKNDSLALVTDQGIFFYDGAGQLRSSFAYPRGSLVTFSHKAGMLPTVALETGDRENRSRVVTADEKGSLLLDRQYPAAVRSLSTSGDKVAVLLSDSVVCETLGDPQAAKSAKEISARDIILCSDGKVMVIYADRAEELKLA